MKMKDMLLEKAQALKTSTDKLRRMLLDAEGAIRSINPGVVADLPVGGICWRKGLADRSGPRQWGIFVLNPQAHSFTHISEASREVQALAAKNLPALVQAILEALNAELTRVQGAILRVEEFLAVARDAQGGDVKPKEE